MYTVTNKYGITGESEHKTVEAAVSAARKREGDGWQVMDEDGNLWWLDAAGQPYQIG